MTAYKKNFDDALLRLKDFVRYGVKTESEIASAEESARKAGHAYANRTSRSVDVDAWIQAYKSDGWNQRQRDSGDWLF